MMRAMAFLLIGFATIMTAEAVEPSVQLSRPPGIKNIFLRLVCNDGNQANKHSCEVNCQITEGNCTGRGGSQQACFLAKVRCLEGCRRPC